VQILRGIAQGVPTFHLVDERGISHTHLLSRCHQIHALVAAHFPSLFAPLSDPVTEADEPYQNAGEKGRKHADSSEPARHRANTARDYGTWANDRPPIVGLVRRRSEQVRLRLCKHADRATREGPVVTQTRADAVVNTDEWALYQHVATTGHRHQTICRAPGARVSAR
jgi:hypothetical protein